MSKPRIILTRRWPEEVEALLAEEFEAVFNTIDRPFSQAELQAAMREADAVLPTVSDCIDAEVIGVEGRRAQLLGNFGVGFDHIDVAAAREAGVAVSNTPGVLTEATADLTMTLLLMAARRAGEGERELRAGDWSGWRPTHLLGTQVSGKTLGLIGMGRIARAVAQRAHWGFGMRVICYNRSPVDPAVLRDLGAEQLDSVDAVLEQSDFVSLHCPATPETQHLINVQALNRMKPDAYLINTARGSVVDERALAQALWFGTIAGAALDVYQGEPRISPELLASERLVLLPHLGSATRETRVAMGMKVVDNLRAHFAGQPLPDRVA